MLVTQPLKTTNELYYRSVILLGTEPENPQGGIAMAMAGYIQALSKEGLLYRLIPSYSRKSIGGKFLLAIKAIPEILISIKKIKKNGMSPVVYSHAGGLPSLVREWILLYLAYAAGAKTMLHLHSISVDDYLRNRFKCFLFRISLLSVDIVCVLTPWWMHRLKLAGIRKQMVVIPNPLPSELEKIAKQIKRKDNVLRDNCKELTVLCMTRLVSGKGVDIAIEAMSYLQQSIKLVVAGDGPERSNFERLARKLGKQDQIHFVGWVSGNKKNRLLETANIFCLPSSYDSFGMGLVEAMSHGMPVVALRWGGIPDMLKNGETGILVDEQDGRQVANAIKRLADDNIRYKMGGAGKKWVLENYSAAIVGKKLRRVIEQI